MSKLDSLKAPIGVAAGLAQKLPQPWPRVIAITAFALAGLGAAYVAWQHPERIESYLALFGILAAKLAGLLETPKAPPPPPPAGPTVVTSLVAVLLLTGCSTIRQALDGARVVAEKAHQFCEYERQYNPVGGGGLPPANVTFAGGGGQAGAP